MAITTTKVLLGGAVGKSNYLDPVVDDLTMLDAAVNGVWTDYSASFAVQAVTTNPTMGNSDVKARYKQIGKTVIYDFWVNLGSTFTPGSGNWRFPLPVPARSATFATITGSAFILDNGTAQRVASLYSVTATQLEMMLATNNAIIGSTGSGTAWAATDLISGCVSYEAA